MHRHPLSASTSARPERDDERGFTLIELMITVAIVAILAAIALPSYRDYILRGQLVEATNLMSAMQTNMERYFQDNRTYRDIVSPVIYAPCDDPSASAIAARKTPHGFTLSCTFNVATPTLPEGYVLTATGSGSTLNFVYTLDQSGNQATTSVGGGWPAVTGTGCWVLKKGQTC